jgi:hypothetical protein
MTWQGILGIIVSSALIALASVWLDDHFFKEIKTCKKCGHINGEENEKESSNR